MLFINLHEVLFFKKRKNSVTRNYTCKIQLRNVTQTNVQYTQRCTFGGLNTKESSFVCRKKSSNFSIDFYSIFSRSSITLLVLADYDSLQALIERRPRRKRTLSFWPHCTTLWTSCIVMKRVTVTFQVSYIAIRAVGVLAHVWPAATRMVWSGRW